MKPYYERDGVAIYCGDCREVLPSLGQRFADVVLGDPPYAATSLTWDRRVRGWLELALVALKPSGSLWCFGSLRSFIGTNFSDWKIAQDIVWEKQNGSGFQADRFKRVHEQAVHLYPRRRNWSEIFKAPVTTSDATPRQVRRKRRPAHMGDVGEHFYVSVDGGPRLMRSVIRVPNCHGRAVHPTQKPEGIIEPLLRYSCPPPGLVLDPFMGSGTTLLVAKQLGLRAVGIELDEAYCAAAAKRLDETLALGGAA